jgi:hypothetical protein
MDPFPSGSRLSGLGKQYLTPFRIALLYAAFCLGLVVLSEVVFPRLIADAGLLWAIQASEGAVEVLASAALIYVLVASAQDELRLKERAMDEAPVGISIADATRSST